MNFIVILDPCNNPTFLKALVLIQNIINVIFIAIPIILIVMLSIDLFKNVISTEEEQKKNLKLIFKRILYAIAVFFVPTIVNIFLTLISDSIMDITSDYNSCIENMDNIEYFEQIAQKLEAEEQKSKEEAVKSKTKIITTIKNYSTSISTSTNEGSSVGKKYTLTDSQLKGIAVICQKEQGTVTGAKAEATLIANRFELFGSSYGTDGTGLYNYVAKSGWWGKEKTTTSYMQSTKNLQNLDSNILATVKQVLVYGDRTALAPYVDEHDCIYCGKKYGYDITKLITDGRIITDKNQLKNHSNYIKDTTIIYNKYGASYTFYTFPTSTSDPFGYTKTAKEKYNKLNK
jgi:hypothetical protein